MLLLLFGYLLPVNAQTEQGNLIVGGGLSGGYSNGLLHIHLGPTVGYFPHNNLLIMGGVGFGFEWQDTESLSYSNLHRPYIFSAGMNIRRYWLPGPLKVFGDAGVSAGFSRNIDLDHLGIPVYRINGHVDGNVKMGVAYFLNKYVAILALYEYRMGAGFRETMSSGFRIRFQINYLTSLVKNKAGE